MRNDPLSELLGSTLGPRRVRLSCLSLVVSSERTIHSLEEQRRGPDDTPHETTTPQNEPFFFGASVYNRISVYTTEGQTACFSHLDNDKYERNIERIQIPRWRLTHLDLLHRERIK